VCVCEREKAGISVRKKWNNQRANIE